MFPKMSCGHVPQMKFLHTLGSHQSTLIGWTPIASGPIICYGAMRCRVGKGFRTSESRCQTMDRSIGVG